MVEPHHLVMFKSKCSYCKQIEGISFQYVSRLFGILHCANHRAEAKQDLYAYLDKHEIVRYYDACNHPNIRPLFQILAKGVSILRSIGEWDPDWKPYADAVESMNLLQKFEQDWWYLFSKTVQETEYLKAVPLSTLFGEDNDPANIKILKEALHAMNEGIYKTMQTSPP